jgi:hypothetical protein
MNIKPDPPVPTVCRSVRYALSDEDVKNIAIRRTMRNGAGTLIYRGNLVTVGQICPMTIVRVWGNEPTSAVNGQVLLDGNDTLWVKSVTHGEGPGHFTWPERQ